MAIIFNESTHTYLNENGEELISATRLLAKHGLAPDYSKVNASFLKAKANIGTMVHKEIDDYLKVGVDGITDEFAAFKKLSQEQNLICINNEYMVANDIVAGTYDMLAIINGKKTLCDFKTTSVLHENAIQWQCSLYVYLLDAERYEDYEIAAYHLVGGNCKYKPLKKISKANIERLIDCERVGMTYTNQDILTIEESNLLLQQENTILEINAYLEEIEKQKELIRSKLLEAIKASGVNSHSLCNGHLLITYVPPTTKESIDSKKLKEENPELYEKYKKVSSVKEQIRIKIKD